MQDGGGEGGGGEGGGDSGEDSDSPRQCMPPPVPADGRVEGSLNVPAAAAPVRVARRALLSSQRRWPLANDAIGRILAYLAQE